MPLPNTVAWRIVQLVTILWCFLLSISVALCSYWLVYQRRSMLNMLVDMVHQESDSKSQNEQSLEFVKMTLFGSYGVVLATVVMGIVSSYGIASEKRWFNIFLIILNWLLFIAALTFGIMGIMASEKVRDLTLDVLKEGIERYTHLKGGASSDENDQWRFVVDRIQIEGRCCGANNYMDYGGRFFNMSIGHKTYSACICQNATNCRLQHVPLSCCKCVNDWKLVDPFCATSIFPNWTSSGCQSAKRMEPNNRYNKNGCDKDRIKKMWHVAQPLWHGAFNIVVAFMLAVLIILFTLMVCKTSTQKQFVKEEIQAVFKVDSEKASNMLKEANEPSASSRSGDKSFSTASNREGDPQRLSSQRLAPTSEIASFGRHGDSERHRRTSRWPSSRGPPSQRSMLSSDSRVSNRRPMPSTRRK